ncbi:DUF1905 domain-containing protein [Hoyosella sp. G463]|uniref:DUF1905 domain-containing protein n=1 Tax=Lolliginicoccus lacisalsi TaxID=2742202 RepID=A0A927PLR5_9ACTN|nr:DUF1905 domain-containing protein [Lolliginicoccus lacisalsi]MBD8505657.1 DUF1905 domain-containing protein [Lolliginicoccus lacisalsi]
MRWVFDADLFLWHGDAVSWTFLRLPLDVAEEIDDRQAGPRAGFGSVRVAATIGATTWHTSVFPDKPTGSFLLPIKKQVRAAEGIAEGDTVTVALEIAEA